MFFFQLVDSHLHNDTNIQYVVALHKKTYIKYTRNSMYSSPYKHLLFISQYNIDMSTLVCIVFTIYTLSA